MDRVDTKWRLFLGDKVRVPIPVSRKWWQIWKPKFRWELRTLTITNITTSGDD